MRVSPGVLRVAPPRALAAAKLVFFSGVTILTHIDALLFTLPAAPAGHACNSRCLPNRG